MSSVKFYQELERGLYQEYNMIYYLHKSFNFKQNTYFAFLLEMLIQVILLNFIQKRKSCQLYSIQKMSKEAELKQHANQWATLFHRYKGKNKVYPTLQNNLYTTRKMYEKFTNVIIAKERAKNQSNPKRTTLQEISGNQIQALLGTNQQIQLGLSQISGDLQFLQLNNLSELILNIDKILQGVTKNFLEIYKVVIQLNEGLDPLHGYEQQKCVRCKRNKEIQLLKKMKQDLTICIGKDGNKSMDWRSLLNETDWQDDVQTKQEQMFLKQVEQLLRNKNKIIEKTSLKTHLYLTKHIFDQENKTITITQQTLQKKSLKESVKLNEINLEKISNNSDKLSDFVEKIKMELFNQFLQDLSYPFRILFNRVQQKKQNRSYHELNRNIETKKQEQASQTTSIPQFIRIKYLEQQIIRLKQSIVDGKQARAFIEKNYIQLLERQKDYDIHLGNLKSEQANLQAKYNKLQQANQKLEEKLKSQYELFQAQRQNLTKNTLLGTLKLGVNKAKETKQISYKNTPVTKIIQQSQQVQTEIQQGDVRKNGSRRRTMDIKDARRKTLIRTISQKDSFKKLLSNTSLKQQNSQKSLASDGLQSQKENQHDERRVSVILQQENVYETQQNEKQNNNHRLSAFGISDIINRKKSTFKSNFKKKRIKTENQQQTKIQSFIKQPLKQIHSKNVNQMLPNVNLMSPTKKKPKPLTIRIKSNNHKVIKKNQTARSPQKHKKIQQKFNKKKINRIFQAGYITRRNASFKMRLSKNSQISRSSSLSLLDQFKRKNSMIQIRQLNTKEAVIERCQGVIQSQFQYLKRVGIIALLQKIGLKNKKRRRVGMVAHYPFVKNQKIFYQITKEDIHLFGGQQDAQNYEKGTGIWKNLDLNANLMIDLRNSYFSLQVQRFFYDLKTHNPKQYHNYCLFLVNPTRIIDDKNKISQYKQQLIMNEKYFIRDTFMKLQRYHKINHRNCSHVVNFLAKIGLTFRTKQQ